MLSHALHLLLPFSLLPEWKEEEISWIQPSTQALPRSSLCNAIKTPLKAMPALRRILRRSTHDALISLPTDTRSCAHEHWLAHYFNLERDTASKNEACGKAWVSSEAALAPYALLADGEDPGTLLWACVCPVHFQLARTHLILHRSTELALSVEEASALFDVAKNIATLYELTLIAPTPFHWYIRGEALGQVIGCSPDQAQGQNIELGLPYQVLDNKTKGYAQVWMQFQNEVQMAWATHPVNRQREETGQDLVNGIWLWGQGAQLSKTGDLDISEHSAPPFSALFSNQNTTQGLGLAAGIPVATTPLHFYNLQESLPLTLPNSSLERTNIDSKPRYSPNPDHASSGHHAPILVELEALIHAAIQHDAQTWQAALMQLERDWFAPALAALQERRLSCLSLTLTGENHWLTLRLKPTDLYKIWRHHTLPDF